MIYCSDNSYVYASIAINHKIAYCSVYKYIFKKYSVNTKKMIKQEYDKNIIILLL